MNLRRLLRRMFLFLILLAALGATLSCTGQESMEPRAWIDAPPDGVNVPVNEPVTIISHGYARQGVAELLLSVNGDAYRRDVPAESGMFGEVRQEWVPTEDGVYTLQVVTYDSTGAASSPAAITLRVGEVIAEAPTVTEEAAVSIDTPTVTITVTGTAYPTDTPTATPTGTTIATATPTATGTMQPTDTPTATPTATATDMPTLTPIPTTPPDIRLWADAQTVQAGSCTTVRWHASAVSAYWIDGQAGAGDDGSFQTCPCQTETHTLRALPPGGGEVNLSVTILVSGQCGGPPPVPSPYVPADGLTVDCRSEQDLVWVPVSHPVSVSYYVKLERRTASTWTSVRTWGPVGPKQVTANVDCDNTYRWTVQAEDSQGYTSDWAPWSEFTVDVGLY